MQGLMYMYMYPTLDKLAYTGCPPKKVNNSFKNQTKDVFIVMEIWIVR